MDYISIGKKIAQIRIKRKLTQEQLSEKLDSSSTYISNIERGVKKPSLKMLVKIASVLEISLDYLVLDNYENNKLRSNAKIDYIMEKLNNLCSESKDVYLDICDGILDRLIQSENKRRK